MAILNNTWDSKYPDMYKELLNKDNAYALQEILWKLDSDLITDVDVVKKSYYDLVDIGEKRLADKRIKPYIR